MSNVDENIKWGLHVDTICRKIACKVGVLKHLKRIVPHETLKQLYNSIVLPHFDYCDIIYGTCTKENLSRLQKLQNRAARFLTGSGPRAHREDMYKKLGPRGTAYMVLRQSQLLKAHGLQFQHIPYSDNLRC